MLASLKRCWSFINSSLDYYIAYLSSAVGTCMASKSASVAARFWSVVAGSNHMISNID